jgi:hypothetical protein
VQAHGSDLEAVARTLARLGYSVKLCASAGGSLHSLKHTFITAARHAAAAPHGESQSPAPCCMCRQPASQHAAPQHLPTTLLPLPASVLISAPLPGPPLPLPTGEEPAEWVIDPSFSQAFSVSQPTPRYAHILSSLPPLLVAPLGRLTRAILLLGPELARCFERQELSLPPWRRVDPLLSRYAATTSVPIRSAQAAAAAAAPAAAASAQLPLGAPTAAGAPGAALRRQLRQQQRDVEKVQLRLVKLGFQLLEPASPPTPDAADSGAAGARGTSSSAASAALLSPKSVIQVSGQARVAGQRIPSPPLRGGLTPLSTLLHGHWLIASTSASPPLPCRQPPSRRSPPPTAVPSPLPKPTSAFVVAGGTPSSGGSSAGSSGDSSTAWAVMAAGFSAARPPLPDRRPPARQFGWPASQFGPV